MLKPLDAQYKITDPAAMKVGPLPPLDRHPGVFIRETLMPEYGVTVAALARHIGVSRPNLHNVLQGRSDVSRDLAYRLGAAMNDHVADLLISYQVNWDKQQEQARRAQFQATIARLPAVKK